MGSGPPHDIFFMNNVNGKWSEPVNPGLPVNTEFNEIYPTISLNGNMYFNSDKPGGYGDRDIYCSRFINGKFTEPENVGEPVSSQYREGDVLIAPDESYIIFVSVDRPGSYGSGDLYICYKTDDNSWSDPVNMGDKINTPHYDYCPVVSPDGKYFFYTSNRNIFWVDAKIISDLR